jgi:FMN phosphatase YigB (HAD superfamily)
MTITLLLDLDDTLLETNTDVFLPTYYKALADHLSAQVPPADLMAALMSGIKLMLANRDPSRTLQQVFEDDFYPRLAIPKEKLRHGIEDFYASVFPTLKAVTRIRPGARELVDWAAAQGHHLAIATDPVFPRQATLERVRWAGLDPAQFDLISSFETFHFTKSQPAFFAEFIGRLGWPDRPILMAGNDEQRDLVPAQALGLPTYHVNGAGRPESQSSEKIAVAVAAGMQGDLGALRSWLQGAQLKPYVQALTTKDAISALLEATPAVLHGLTLDLTRLLWTSEPSRDDWALIELVCHLRDTEREVHHEQIARLIADSEPFVPRPDAAIWAKQRRYLTEDGPAALRELAAARMETINRLRDLPDEIWSKPARHAIFGPTNFMEVVGFMADHDRMHLQQAWNTLSVQTRPAYRN